MRRRLVLTSVLALLLFSTGWLLGDDKAPTRKRSNLPPYWSKLKLTEDQKKKVHDIQGEYRPKIEALQQQIDELEKKERADLQKVLTDSQRSQLKKILASRFGGEPDDDKGDKTEKTPAKKGAGNK